MAERTVTFEASGGQNQPNIIRRIVTAVEELHNRTPLQDFTFRDAPGEPATTKLYRWRCADGRVWRQHLDFLTLPADPLMDWPGDSFRVTEFEPHRDLRLACIEGYTSIALVRFDWSV